jgi:hypothetical protein
VTASPPATFMSLGGSDITTTPDGHGYWLTNPDGAVAAYGNAGYYGSEANIPLNAPIVGIAPTPDGHGYWLTAGDGGVFAFGDAPFYGSEGNAHLDQPVVDITPTSNGRGYWITRSRRGVWLRRRPPQGAHHRRYQERQREPRSVTLHQTQPVEALSALPPHAPHPPHQPRAVSWRSRQQRDRIAVRHLEHWSPLADQSDRIAER